MADVIIRQATIKDVDEIYEIERLCFAEPWSKDALVYEFEENPRAFYVVAELDGQVVGYAGLWWILDEGHITNVAVRPGFRNRKIVWKNKNKLRKKSRSRLKNLGRPERKNAFS